MFIGFGLNPALVKQGFFVTLFFNFRIIECTKTNDMKIADYKAGDKVEVLVNNPRNNNKDEWRNAEVLDKRTIYPNNGSHHPPYPILIVRLTRTYCQATPVYRWVDGNIPVFVTNNLHFYDKENEEGVIYENQIKLKV